MATVQDANFFGKVLKEYYLPAWKNQLGTEPSPLLGKIKTYPVTGKKIVAVAPIGLSGGFGFGEEGLHTPMAGAVMHEAFEEKIKDMYVNINISDKVMKLSANSQGAMLNALDVEVKASYETAKWNVGRALFGTGLGILSNISASSTNTVDVADCKLLKEGLIVDIFAEASPVGSSPTISGRRILAVDRINKKIVLDGVPTNIPKGFITVQNSYGREITGVGAIFDDNITHLYGLEKATNPFLYPTVKDCGGNIEDGYITAALREAQNFKNSKVDMLLCGDAAFDNYVDYLRTNNVRNEKTDLTIEGGFKAIAFVFGNRVVEVVNESFVPDTETWGFDTAALQLHLVNEWEFVQKDSGVFTLMNDTAIFRALLVCYGNLICTNPGGCLRLTNCA